MPENNPYHPLSPPQDPTLFFGRENAIAFLRQHLVGAHNQEMLVILGRNGIGKSSLLQHVPFIVDERYQPVYLNILPEQVISVYALVIFAVDNILNRMEVIGASTYRVPDLPAPEAPDSEILNWFASDFLDVVLTAIRRDRFLLLMLDNYQFVLDAVASGTLPRNFFDYLQKLLHDNERLEMLASVPINYEEQALQSSVTANLNFHFRLGHLTEQAARQLITEPIAAYYHVSDEVVDYLLRLGGGYPFLLHSLCRLIYRYREGTPQLTMIQMNHAQAVYDAALEETGEIMRPYWDQAALNERHVLLALVNLQRANPDQPVMLDAIQDWLKNTRVNLNETQVASTLRKLEYSTLLTSKPEGIRFNTSLECDWLAQNAQLSTAESRQVLSRGRIASLMGVVLVILIIAGILMSGILDNEDTVAPSNDIQPTLTLAIERVEEPIETEAPAPDGEDTP